MNTSKPKRSVAEFFLKELRRDALQEGQAPFGDPHWIVMCLSVRRAVAAGQTRPRFHFRHATQEAAENEAKRLAAASPGWRFGVFEAGPTFKVDEIAPGSLVVAQEAA